MSAEQVKHNIDIAIEILSHPFFMTLAGLMFWFALRWSINRNAKGVEYKFWHDQKDEMVVTAIGALIFLVWDDEIIHAYYDLVLDQQEHDHEMKSYYYLIVGFAVERLYQLYSKLTKNGNH